MNIVSYFQVKTGCRGDSFRLFPGCSFGPGANSGGRRTERSRTRDRSGMVTIGTIIADGPAASDSEAGAHENIE